MWCVTGKPNEDHTKHERNNIMHHATTSDDSTHSHTHDLLERGVEEAACPPSHCVSKTFKECVKWCRVNDPEGQTFWICQSAIDEVVDTTSMLFYWVAVGFVMLGTILAGLAFTKLLRVTQHRIEHIANPSGAFTPARQRLVEIGEGGPWFGIMLQLTLEQILFGFAASLMYGWVARAACVAGESWPGTDAGSTEDRSRIDPGSTSYRGRIKAVLTRDRDARARSRADRPRMDSVPTPG